LLISVFLYQLHLIKKSEPSLESLGKTFPVTGKMHYEYLGRMGRVPQLDGHPLYCSACFLGGADSCQFVFSLHEGVSVTGSVVAMPTKWDEIWLAMELRTAAGDYYRAKPEEVIREWWHQSYAALWQTPLFLLLVLGVVPWFVWLRLRLIF
jgi:hypothetical protein